jgi:hypothetical protein
MVSVEVERAEEDAVKARAAVRVLMVAVRAQAAV